MRKLYTLCLVLFCFQLSLAANDNKSIDKDILKLELLKYSKVKKDNIVHIVGADPISIIIKEGIKKVIRAMDLVMQRLQRVQLGIQTALEAAKNAMSNSKLGEINEFVTEKKEIFDKYYKELWTIKNNMDQIKAIKEAVLAQGKMIGDFTQLFKKFNNDAYFTEKELDIIFDIYNGMLEKNVDAIQDLWVVAKNYSVKMQDGNRLAMIKGQLDIIKKVSGDFNAFTAQVIKLSMSRATNEREVNQLKLYYGIEG